MVLSRAQSKAALAYILEKLLGLEAADNIPRAFDQNGILGIQDLTSLTTDAIDTMKFEEANPSGEPGTRTRVLSLGDTGKIHAVLGFHPPPCTSRTTNWRRGLDSY